jgi:hypothetical protein
VVNKSINHHLPDCSVLDICGWHSLQAAALELNLTSCQSLITCPNLTALSPHFRPALQSLKAAALRLNLTVANHMVLA